MIPRQQASSLWDVRVGVCARVAPALPFDLWTTLWLEPDVTIRPLGFEFQSHYFAKLSLTRTAKADFTR